MSLTTRVQWLMFTPTPFSPFTTPEMITAPTTASTTTTPITKELPVLTTEVQTLNNDNSNDTANVTEPSLQPIIVEGKGLFKPSENKRERYDTWTRENLLWWEVGRQAALLCCTKPNIHPFKARVRSLNWGKAPEGTRDGRISLSKFFFDFMHFFARRVVGVTSTPQFGTKTYYYLLLMFSQATVILPTGGVGWSASVHAGIPPPEQTPPPQQTPPPPSGADTPPQSRHPPEQTPTEQTPPTRRPHQSRHPPGKQTPAYGQWAAGTHPTGMHSCLARFLPKTAWKW